MNKLFIYWLAIRPKTLSISVTPVLLGSSLAWYFEQVFSITVFIVTLFSVLCIQIATNLYNDAADFERGADNSDRIGPDRVTQQGWLTAKQVKQGAVISFILAFISGIYLAYIGGVVIIMLGLLSIISGYAYTAGPKPIAYTPLGELFVIIFFGFVAVNGTYFLQTQDLNLSTFILSSALGTMAAAILLVNNYRDLDQDQMVKKLTLVYYIKRPNSRIFYAFLILYPYLLLVLMLNTFSWFLLLPLLSIGLALRYIKLLFKLEISPKLNVILAKTAQLQLIYTLLLCFSLFL